MTDHPEWCLQGIREIVTECGLVDLPISGYPFTWIRYRGNLNEVQVKLEKSLVFEDWLAKFPQILSYNVFAPVSNHSHIVLQTEDQIAFSPCRSFKFENNV